MSSIIAEIKLKERIVSKLDAGALELAQILVGLSLDHGVKIRHSPPPKKVPLPKGVIMLRQQKVPVKPLVTKKLVHTEGEQNQETRFQVLKVIGIDR